MGRRRPDGLTVKEQIAQSDEHREQKNLFLWAAWHVGQHPELALMFAIPNGGKRDAVTASKLKDEGVKAGVPDICLPVARQGWHGLFIELKWGYGQASELQKEWSARLTDQGYLAVVVNGWQEAADVLRDYLGIDET